MAIHIIGAFDKNKLYCTGSLTKFLMVFVSLSFLSKKYQLKDILNDDNFFDSVANNQQAKDFLNIFQNLLGGKFSLHDICSYYAGLPYTFDPSPEEMESVELGLPFKHHSILEEKTFLHCCQNFITPVFRPKSKFHYSEISIIFLGYFLEIAFSKKTEIFFKEFLIDKFKLTQSLFSRTRPSDVYTQDLSDKYDYPAIAILDHGYFCYSNGFYTTLNDMKTLVENLLNDPVFNFMIDINHARAASNRLMNGLAIEMRRVGNDLIIGYEGLSFSGCNLWAYSFKKDEGYITFNDSEEEVYTIVYDNLFKYSQFDNVPDYTQAIYKKFKSQYQECLDKTNIPKEYQGHYHRVKINEKILKTIFEVGEDFITIRNPEEIKYPVILVNNVYRIKGKDNIHSSKVGFFRSNGGSYFMYFDGNLYKKI